MRALVGTGCPIGPLCPHHLAPPLLTLSPLAPRRPTVAAGLRADRAGIDTEGGSPKIEEREERGKEGSPKREEGREKKGVLRGEKKRRTKFERKKKKRTLYHAPGEKKGYGGGPKGQGKGQGQGGQIIHQEGKGRTGKKENQGKG